MQCTGSSSKAQHMNFFKWVTQNQNFAQHMIYRFCFVNNLNLDKALCNKRLQFLQLYLLQHWVL